MDRLITWRQSRLRTELPLIDFHHLLTGPMNFPWARCGRVWHAPPAALDRLLISTFCLADPHDVLRTWKLSAQMVPRTSVAAVFDRRLAYVNNSLLLIASTTRAAELSPLCSPVAAGAMVSACVRSAPMEWRN